MSRQRPTEAEIAESMSLPHLRQKDAGQEPSTDPLMPTPMVVEAERIKAYDHNPRQVTNSEYEAIKESIQAAGMEQTLTITRRPGDERYMMAAGANSRLRAVQELWRETGEERFRSIPCLYRPWTDEVDMLAGHLRESIHGPLIFIDRARAIRHLRELIEAETGEGRLSHAALERALRERGYGVSRPLIVWLEYAVEVLYPAIPTLLERGMGRPQIEKIRAHERAYTEVWKSLEVGDLEEARAIFVAVLAKMEDIEFLDFDALRIDLCDEINVAADDVDLHRIRNGFDLALQGQPVGDLRAGLREAASRESGLNPPAQERPLGPTQGSAPRAAEPASAPAQHPAAPIDTPATPPTLRPAPTSRPLPGSGLAGVMPAPSAPPARDRPRPPLPEADDDPPPERPPADADDKTLIEHGTQYLQWREREVQRQRAKPFLPFGMELPPDLPGLRAEAWKSAGLYSEHARIGYIVTELPEAGFGFLVGPPQPLSDNMTQGERRELAAAWWSLVVLSGQFAPDSQASRYMPKQWQEPPIGEALRQGLGFEMWYESYVHHTLHMDPKVSGALRANANSAEPGIQPMDRKTCQVMDAMPWVGLSEQALGLLAVTERAWTSWWYLATYCRAIRRLTNGNPWAQG